MQRWLTVNRGKQTRRKSNQLLLEKGKMAVAKKGIKNTKSLSPAKQLSLLPEGVFEDAELLVYSEDVKNRRSREKRSPSSNGEGRKNRHHFRRKSHGPKGRRRMGCKRHAMYVDFMEVRTYALKFLLYQQFLSVL